MLRDREKLQSGVGAVFIGPAPAVARHDLIRDLSRLALAANLPTIACFAVPFDPTDQPPLFMLRQGDLEWLERYEQERMDRHDPLVRAARKLSEPFCLSDIGRTNRLSTLEHDLIGEAAARGLTEAFVTPIWELGGRLGLVMLAGRGRSLTAALRAELSVASIVAYVGLCAQVRAQSDRPLPLTDREEEIVRWIAAGKSDWEIGQILDISAKTVNFHVENLKRKLGVASRIQAVLRAIELAKFAG